MHKFPMTVSGEKQLRDELQELKSVVRPQIIAAIATAREYGDLKENSEYHAAREQQGFTEARIKEIEGKLANCQVIDTSNIAHTGKVIFGTRVRLFNTSTDKEVNYQIVGDDEADIKQHKISVNSPIARALIGKHEGDIVKVSTPGGTVEYEIDQVSHN